MSLERRMIAAFVSMAIAALSGGPVWAQHGRITIETPAGMTGLPVLPQAGVGSGAVRLSGEASYLSPALSGHAPAPSPTPMMSPQAPAAPAVPAVAAEPIAIAANAVVKSAATPAAAYKARNGGAQRFAAVLRAMRLPGASETAYDGGVISSDRDVVLVTGSGDGIGLAIARNLIADGYRVVMTAREKSLQGLRDGGFQEGERLMLLPLDVTSNEQRKAAVARVNARWGGVDILVNNAAVVIQGAVEHLDETDLQRSMDTNFLGPAALTSEVLPTMRLKGRGRIFNVTSMTAVVPSPFLGAYAASKSALNSYMSALGQEVSAFGTKVSSVELGFIRSDAHAKIVTSKLAEEVRGDPANPYLRASEEMGRSMSMGRRLAIATPESVARDIVRQLKADSPRAYSRRTLDAVVLNLLGKILPKPAFHGVLDFLLFSTSKLEPLAARFDALPRKSRSGMSKAVAAIRYFADHLTGNLEHRTISLAPGTRLAIGKRLGRGLGGAVYELDGGRNHPLIIKTPHFVRGTGVMLRYPHSVILHNRELSLYRLIREQYAQIEGASSYPVDPYWERASMPVIPIVDVIKSRMGDLIVKPRITGISLAQIHQRYSGKPPSEVVESLRAIYQFSQALFEASRLKDLHPAVPLPSPIERSLFIDLNPTNLIWIEAPAELRRLKMSRPGFMLYELGEFASPKYRKGRTTFEKFLAEFKDAARADSEMNR